MRKLKFLIVLIQVMLAAGCGNGIRLSGIGKDSEGGGNGVQKDEAHGIQQVGENKPEVTQLTYTINLKETDSEGNYLCNVGDLVRITATATGPKAENAKWKINPNFGAMGIDYIGS